ncbi:MAG: hypothetical protein Q9212_005597 [Teloschistes hypoglaucus]
MATLKEDSPMAHRIKPCYYQDVDRIRYDEYPMLKDTFYLDHAGTTPYPRSLIEQSSRDLMQNLYGNPHSGSPSSQLSTRRVEDVRLRALRFFRADPDDFDLVFVANATAGIKLVMEGFRELQGGFWYGYHQDSHTSLVGVRENASEHHCFGSDDEVEMWLETQPMSVWNSPTKRGGLFAYPAQSNLNGRRLPFSWPGRLRSTQYPSNNKIYSLLDAAAFVSTSPLDFSDASEAPDFTVLSFYKMFGFPDLGALIIRKDSSWPLVHRKYFGGGTVEMVTCMNESWHVRKQDNLHEQLEDGTLPFHSIIALDSAFSVHEKLFGSLERISSHTSFLADRLYKHLSSLRHANGRTVCKIHKDPRSSYCDSTIQGPIVALNLQSSRGESISNAEVEKVAAIRNIQIRTGGLCNPGGVASCLELTPWEMKRNFSAGHRCGNENDLIGGKLTGIIRVSLGATSNIQDIEAFVHFLEEFFVDNCCYPEPRTQNPNADTSFYIESLSVYPIKSCGPWQVPSSMPWDVRPEGLAWDREWCLIHQGTRAALSQKRIPRMALIRPHLDFEHGVLRVRYAGRLPLSVPCEISVPLSGDQEQVQDPCTQRTNMCYSSRVCGDSVSAYTYNDPNIAAFFTAVLSTPSFNILKSHQSTILAANHPRRLPNPSALTARGTTTHPPLQRIPHPHDLPLQPYPPQRTHRPEQK